MSVTPDPYAIPEDGSIPEFLRRAPKDAKPTFKEMIDKIADKPEEKVEDIFD